MSEMFDSKGFPKHVDCPHRCMAFNLDGEQIYPIKVKKPKMPITENVTRYTDIDDLEYLECKKELVKAWSNLQSKVKYNIGTFEFELLFNKVVIEEKSVEGDLQLHLTAHVMFRVMTDGKMTNESMNGQVFFKHQCVVNYRDKHKELVDRFVDKCKDDLLCKIKEEYIDFILQDCGKFI